MIKYLVLFLLIATNAFATSYELSTNNVGINTASPTATLGVGGDVAIGGVTYTSASSTPTNGAIIQGNVGIGSTNPGAALDVQGSLRLTGIGTFVGSGNSYFNGNVGIGTAFPQYQLDINGNIGNFTGALGLYAGGTNANINFTPSGTGQVVANTNPNANGVTGMTYNNNYITSSNSAVILAAFAPNITAGAQAQTILGVKSSNYDDVGETFHYTGDNSTANYYGWNFYGGNPILSLAATGNVGIGNITAPAQALDVNGTVRMTGFQMHSASTTNYVLTATDSSGDATWQASSGGGGAQYWLESPGNVGIYTVNPGYNVGIGTASPAFPLQVNGAFETYGNTSTTLLNQTGGNVGIGTTLTSGILSIGGGCATHAGQPACIAATATGAALGYCNGGLSAACGTCVAC